MFYGLEREEQVLLLTYALERDEEEVERAGNLFGRPKKKQKRSDGVVTKTTNVGAPKRKGHRRKKS